LSWRTPTATAYAHTYLNMHRTYLQYRHTTSNLLTLMQQTKFELWFQPPSVDALLPEPILLPYFGTLRVLPAVEEIRHRCWCTRSTVEVQSISHNALLLHRHYQSCVRFIADVCSMRFWAQVNKGDVDEIDRSVWIEEGPEADGAHLGLDTIRIPVTAPGKRYNCSSPIARLSDSR
jgi:hypothetical protein